MTDSWSERNFGLYRKKVARYVIKEDPTSYSSARIEHTRGWFSKGDLALPESAKFCDTLLETTTRIAFGRYMQLVSFDNNRLHSASAKTQPSGQLPEQKDRKGSPPETAGAGCWEQHSRKRDARGASVNIGPYFLERKDLPGVGGKRNPPGRASAGSGCWGRPPMSPLRGRCALRLRREWTTLLSGRPCRKPSLAGCAWKSTRARFTYGSDCLIENRTEL